MNEIDFKFGENICEPLNLYYSHHISEIIDTLASLSLDDEVYCEKCLADLGFFKRELTKYAYAYIERKYYNITEQAFDILFSTDESLIKIALDIFKGLLDLKRIMINYK